MTLKLVDTAPDEAQIVELSERLNRVISTASDQVGHLLDGLDASYLDAAREMLAILSDKVSPCISGQLPLTRQQIETYLDFDPAYLEAAKVVLKDFIARRERQNPKA